MKKIISFTILIAMIIGVLGCTSAWADEGIDPSIITGPNMIDFLDYYNPFTSVETVDDVLEAANASKNYFTQLGEIMNKDSVKAYKASIRELSKNPNPENAQAVLQSFSDLQQDYSFADRVIFLWGDKNEKMPYADSDKGDKDPVTTGAFLIEFPADDPAAAKGNILLLSGGDGTTTCVNESFPAAREFSSRGYNCFVFQVRSADASTDDSIMDVQRALKTVRYTVEAKSYGGADMIVGNGYSMGNIRIMNVLTSMTEDDNASMFTAGYEADEIDAYSSDMDVYINIYGGPFNPLPDDIEHLPALFMCSGTEDATGATPRLEQMYEQFKDRVPCELYVIEGAVHGFGVGIPGGNGIPEDSEQWTIKADAFMQENMGFSSQYTAD